MEVSILTRHRMRFRTTGDMNGFKTHTGGKACMQTHGKFCKGDEVYGALHVKAEAFFISPPISAIPDALASHNVAARHDRAVLPG